MTGTAPHTTKSGFEDHYLSLRQKEGRLYSDTEVQLLPDIAKQHPHYAEWQSRKESVSRLRNYFGKKLSLLKILEVGCGNGWLSHFLAYIPGCDVTGTDVNFTELQQGSRVFSHIPNLKFVYGGIDAAELEGEYYDFIVFASSIHYFSCLETIIETARKKLRPGGEIHILDTPFYKRNELAAAKLRTEAYYQATGFPEMAEYYYHHSMDNLQTYSPKILYSTSFINRRLLNNKNPFPWICIRK